MALLAPVDPPPSLQCSHCKVAHPITQFHKGKRYPHGRHPWCRNCRRAAWEKRYAENGETIRENQGWRSMQWRYGLSQDDFEAMAAAQNGLCAICGKPETDPRKKRLTVDHDHACCPGDRGQTCGKCIRGLLCNACNRLIGIAADDPERLLAAAAYLRRQ